MIACERKPCSETEDRSKSSHLLQPGKLSVPLCSQITWDFKGSSTNSEILQSILASLLPQFSQPSNKGNHCCNCVWFQVEMCALANSNYLGPWESPGIIVKHKLYVFTWELPVNFSKWINQKIWNSGLMWIKMFQEVSICNPTWEWLRSEALIQFPGYISNVAIQVIESSWFSWIADHEP